LVPVPRLDSRKKTMPADFADRDIARSGLGPRRRVAFGNLGTRPLAVLPWMEHVNAGEACGEDVIAPIAIPVADVDAVHDSAVLAGDSVPLPLAGPIEHERRLIAIVGRRGLRSGERCIDHHGSASVNARQPQSVRGGEPVDLADRPWLL